jgi:hypothetical protein
MKKYSDNNGYVRMHIPGTGNGAYVLEHRWVMQQVLGRLLSRKEVVHHRDGDKHNNNPCNLVILTPGEHMSHHRKTSRYSTATEKRCALCKQIKNRSEFCKVTPRTPNSDTHHVYCRDCASAKWKNSKIRKQRMMATATHYSKPSLL